MGLPKAYYNFCGQFNGLKLHTRRIGLPGTTFGTPVKTWYRVRIEQMIVLSSEGTLIQLSEIYTDILSWDWDGARRAALHFLVRGGLNSWKSTSKVNLQPNTIADISLLKTWLRKYKWVSDMEWRWWKRIGEEGEFIFCGILQMER